MDNGITTNVLFYNMCDRMKLPKAKLMVGQSPLYGFNREVVILKGVTTLLLTLDIEPRHLNLMVDFLIVKVASMYNVILVALA